MVVREECGISDIRHVFAQHDIGQVIAIGSEGKIFDAEVTLSGIANGG